MLKNISLETFLKGKNADDRVAGKANIERMFVCYASFGFIFHFSSSPEIFSSMLLKALTKQSVGGGLEHKKLMK